MLLVLILCATFRSDDDRLVARLGDNDFRVRKIADAALRERGWQARWALVRGTQSEDLEVRRRCGELHGVALDAEVASLEPLPMLDALWFDRHCQSPTYRTQRTLVTQLLYERFHPYIVKRNAENLASPRLWYAYYVATDDAVRDLLLAGVSRDELRDLFVELRRRDDVFLKGESSVYHPQYKFGRTDGR